MVHHREHSAAIAAGLMLAGFLSGGCILFQPYVRDLKFSRIEKAQAHRAAPANSRAQDLRLFFTTNYDLANLGSAGVALMDVGLCPSAERARLPTTGPYFVSPWRVGGDQLPEGIQRPFTYEALITYDPDLLSGDVRVTGEPEDLCFKVSAASYFGAGGFDSRAALIPRDALDAALHESRKR